MTSSRNLTRTVGHVSRAERERQLGQRGCVVWLTGLSGAGKSTIGYELDRRLHEQGRLTCPLDGDNVRHGLNRDLGFSPADRQENIRRIGEVAALLASTGVIAIVSFISPYRTGRDAARTLVGADRFIEVYVNASLTVCEARDPKGLYKRARAGELEQFTGIGAPYEVPTAPDIIVDTERHDVQLCVGKIVAHLHARRVLEYRRASSQC